MKTIAIRLFPLLAALLVASCSTAPTIPAATESSMTAMDAVPEGSGSGQGSQVSAYPDSDPGNSDDSTALRESITLGSGEFVQGARGSEVGGYAAEDGVTLNFEQASLPEFLRVVFETILGENYLIDPQVKGNVTLYTTRPVTRATVLPVVEAVLEQNNAALVKDGGMYRIVPLVDAAGASGSPSVGRYSSSSRTGYGIQVVPLAHVSAAELEPIIAPFVPNGSSLRVDATRNVLILSGPRYRLDDLLATIRTFDVDWLKGMSFAMFTLEYADAASVVAELDSVIQGAGDSPIAGIVKLVPIERLNAVLAITHRPEHIAVVQKLVDKFDWGIESTSGRRLFVYELENGKAESIAAVLQDIFAGGREDEVAEPVAGSSFPRRFRSAEQVTRSPPEPGSPAASGASYTAAPARRPTTAAADGSEGLIAESRNEVTIIADQDNNAILVLASQQDYRAIEPAIRRLDVAPRQVLIEATIAEVTLSDTLSYGVRWFIENSNNQFGYNAPVPTQASGEGFALALFDASNDLRVFFDALATESSVKFLSTPQVMVLDNQTANIRVGDQIPVTTRSSQSTTNPDAPIVTEVQFRDTGTLLTVTPRINAGGQITLDISQEVSLPGTEPAVGGGGNVSIAQRTINSSVIVQSGQAVVLGGLILETTNTSKSGVPILKSIPGMGALFSTTSEDVFRTELIITVSPTVIENEREMRKVTEELRLRMAKASEYEESVSGGGN